ncbi:MAG: M28 family peptidase, partial [Calditrichaeota bacterium]|nr:M28 family peptidase [Calditrichota bacterium]
FVINVIEDDATADQLIPAYYGYTNQANMSLEKSEGESFVYLLIRKKVLEALLKMDDEDDFNSEKMYEFDNKIRIQLKSESETVMTQNVVAYLEGTDPVLKKEYVGFGAHYDHVGVDGNKIFNGADDDGSGTVGVLTIAKTIAMQPTKRSIFIIFHTGEEKGLYGSEYYTNHPLIPLKDMVTVLNIDMIGSYYQPDKVHIIGADRISQELHDINVMMNKETVNMDLDYTYNAENHPERLYYRSDHYNYAKKGIPIIFYTNDNPDHYHKESDTVETINFTKMKRITELALATGYYVANKAERLKIKSSTASN